MKQMSLTDRRRTSWIVKCVVYASTGALLTGSRFADAQQATPLPTAITTPDRVESPIGTLEYQDGVPTEETAQKVKDALDFTQALNAYNNSFRAHQRSLSARASRASAPRTTRSSSFPS